jgi:Calcineurin-like phosphoesterase
MHKITGDRDAIEAIMQDTVRHFEQEAQAKKGGTKAMSASKKGSKKGAASEEDVADVWQRGLDRVQDKTVTKKGGVRSASAKKAQDRGERAVDTTFAPRDQYIALFQSAMDEYLDETVGPAEPGGAQKGSSKKTTKAASAKKSSAKGKPEATLDTFYKGAAKKGTKKAGTKTRASDIFAQFGNLDPRWVEVAAEKAKLWFKGKHDFISHNSPEDFRFRMDNETTVAIVGDWGGGNEAAQSVAKQMAKLSPNHVIHLGDVYYSGTPKEVQERFLKYWPKPKDPGTSFALNSNHEMYSGGYGYFDYTLKQFKQPASYFSLANDNWRFIGLDTGYDDHDLHDPQTDWLRGQFAGNGPKTIFMSHHQLFSAYEKSDTSKLSAKVQPFLSKVYGWIWGHEHLAVIYEKYQGIKAICLGNGCFPYNLPKGKPSIPVKWMDDHPSTDKDYSGGHTFALLKIKGPRIDLDFIDENGETRHTETWE